MQRDEQARIDAARDQARKEGRVSGRIQLLQSLLNLAVSSDDALECQPMEQLKSLESNLQRRLRDRGMS